MPKWRKLFPFISKTIFSFFFPCICRSQSRKQNHDFDEKIRMEVPFLSRWETSICSPVSKGQYSQLSYNTRIGWAFCGRVLCPQKLTYGSLVYERRGKIETGLNPRRYENWRTSWSSDTSSGRGVVKREGKRIEVVGLLPKRLEPG